MEVHAHTHTERKKFTHYLWEFLMLFFAVFCGFLAENQREHIVEYKRAKEYAQSLLSDLQHDTADLKRASFYLARGNMMIDSLIEFENNNDLAKKGGLFYYYTRLAGWGFNIDWSKATINQLINSGSLRYFSNTQLITEISTYNTTANTISFFEEIIHSARERATECKEAFLDSRYNLLFTRVNMDNLYYHTNLDFIDSVKKLSIPLHNNDPDLLNKYTNAMITSKGSRSSLIAKYYPRAINEAIEIMELLKKEYNLK